MKKKKGLILSIVVALALIIVPVTVKVVLENTLDKARAEIDSGAAYSHRIPIEASEENTAVENFLSEHLPEIAGGVVFVWLASIILFVGLKKRSKSEGA